MLICKFGKSYFAKPFRILIKNDFTVRQFAAYVAILKISCVWEKRNSVLILILGRRPLFAYHATASEATEIAKKFETAFTSDKERYLRQMWRSNACLENHRKLSSLAHLRANLPKHSMLRRKLTYCYDWGQKLLLMIDEWKTGFSKKRLILFEQFLYLSFKRGAQRFGMIQINDLNLKKLKEIKTLFSVEPNSLFYQRSAAFWLFAPHL